MARRRRGRHETNIDMAPLVDMVFLLLIYFMVSTNFVRESQLRIELPEATGVPDDARPDIIELVVDQSGDYAVEGRLLVDNTLDTLVTALAAAKKRSPEDVNLTITADANARHQSVVRAMDAAGKVGLVHISITTQQPAAQATVPDERDD